MTDSFQCVRCGACCRQPGEVRLQDNEVAPMAALLGMGVEDFTTRHTRLRDDRQGLSLQEHPDGTCIFLEGTPPSCRIQAAKPEQCRAFPSAWRYDNMSVCAGGNPSTAISTSAPSRIVPAAAEPKR